MPLLAAALCGLLLTLALPPLGWWPFAFAVAPVFALVARARGARRAFWLGATFAAPFFALYVLWLPRSFAELFGPAFWAVYPFMLAVLSLFWGLTTWGAWRLAALSGGATPRARARRTIVYLPLLWVLVEWARTQGYFAFPWGTLGYAWLDTPVAQLAAQVGVYGLSLLVVVPAALAAAPWAAPAAAPAAAPWAAPARTRAARAAPATLAAAVLVGAAFLAGFAADDGAPELGAPGSGAPELRALLVQGDVDPFARAASAAGDLNTHLRLTEDAVSAAAAAGDPPFDLVVWPEGAVLGYDLGAGDAGPLRAAITDSAPGATFIVGGRTYRGGRDYNSLLALERGAAVGRYDKHYLVPFGERWPLYEPLEGVYAAVFRAFGLPLLASTSPGETVAPVATRVGLVGAYVCYESVFPQVQRELVADGADVLVLATNDAWFGVGAGAWQHFDMGRLRAIETRRWLLRAGNDGVTAAIDPWGRVTAEAPRGVPTTLTASFGPRTDLTFWVRYGGLTPALLLAALVAAAGIGAATRPRR
ncbi:MAG: apolipoprotein N-acyltransferase [Trueperaceae bacterium]|nr:apolipoprotein N-acyltransferase [Trueperaceae bacterium]